MEDEPQLAGAVPADQRLVGERKESRALDGEDIVVGNGRSGVGARHVEREMAGRVGRDAEAILRRAATGDGDDGMINGGIGVADDRARDVQGRVSRSGEREYQDER
jgi:hypothetical protein